MKKTIRIITVVILLIIMTMPSFGMTDPEESQTDGIVAESIETEEETAEAEPENIPSETEKKEEVQDIKDVPAESGDNAGEDTAVNADQDEKQSAEQPAIDNKVKRGPAAAPKVSAPETASNSAAKGSDEPFALRSITWKMTNYHEFFGVGYHQRKVTHVNGIDVNTQSDLQSSYAFCIEPREIGPEGWDADTGDSFLAEDGKDGLKIYTYNAGNVGEYAMMRKMCYYLPGGYGWNSKTSRWYRDYMDSVQTNEFTEYTLSATVLAKQWAKDADDPEGNANYGYVSLSAKGKALVDKFLKEVPGLPDPPSGYIAFYVEKSECQDIWGSLYDEPASGYITVTKKSAQPSLTDAIPVNYSLQGAKYYVYTDAGCKTRARDLYDNEIILTTDKSGKASAVKLAAGDYWVKEAAASKGYGLDKTAYHLTVTADKTATAVSSEQPDYALFNALLEKQSEEFGYRRLIGAEYTLSYYDTQPDTKDVSGLKPKNTWVFRTREGKDPDSGASVACIDFMKDKPVSGGNMYMAGDNVIMPVGVFTLKETKAPRGLAVDPKTYIGSVSRNAGETTAKAVINGSDTLYVDYSGRFRLLNTEAEKTVRLIIQKKDADTGLAEAQGREDERRKAAFGSLEGAVYEVYLNDHSVAEDPMVGRMTTDSNGRAELSTDSRTGKGLMPGTYYIREIKASPGYVVDSHSEKEEKNRYQDGKHIVTARVSEDGDESVYEYTVDSKEAPHHTVIHKTDVTSGKELPGAKLQVIDSDGKLVEEWISSDTPHDIAALPDGKYTLREITAPYGYETAEDAEFEVKDDTVISDVVMKDRPVTITTTAEHSATRGHTGIASGEAVITDTVHMEGLTKGKSFKITGILMDRKSGKPVTGSGGTQIADEKVFTAEQENMTVDLKFPVDQTVFTDDTAVVAFEKLYRMEEGEDNQGPISVELQKHEDLNNEDQTIHYGGIAQTDAKDKKSGTHNVVSGKDAAVIDTVRYNNLSVKDKYTVTGELFDKTSGKLTGIKATGEFTPESPDGEIQVEFRFDATGLEGHDLVVFEKLYVTTIDNKIVLVDKHENPEDKAQTVHIETKPAGPKTGDDITIYIYLSLITGALTALLQMVRKRMSGNDDQM